jgi:hypothetical protein
VGERTSYRPGTLSWADLATTDANAVFSLFEGEFED